MQGNLSHSTLCTLANLGGKLKLLEVKSSSKGKLLTFLTFLGLKGEPILKFSAWAMGEVCHVVSGEEDVCSHSSNTTALGT